MNKYTIHLSNDTINIDEDELQGVLDKLPTGQTIKVRQGLFNPSFYVSITKNELETQNHTIKVLTTDGRIVKKYEKYQDDFKDIDFSEVGRQRRLSATANKLLN